MSSTMTATSNPVITTTSTRPVDPTVSYVDQATSYADARWIVERDAAYVDGFRGTSLPIFGRGRSVAGAEAHTCPDLGITIDRRRGHCVVANRVAMGDILVRHLPSVPGRGEHMN